MPATPAWPPKSAPRLFVPAPLVEGVAVSLDGPQAHYLSRVMRVGEGDIVILCDDVTGEWLTRVTQIGKRRVDLKVERLLGLGVDIRDASFGWRSDVQGLRGPMSATIAGVPFAGGLELDTSAPMPTRYKHT